MIEEWRPVVGYEGLYEVSSGGRVRSVPRLSTGRRAWKVPGRQLKPGCGLYKYVNLWRDGGQKHFSIHTLVLTAFVGPKPEGMECRHLDGYAYNNSVDNLEWATHAVNIRDKIKHGTEPTGRARWSAKDSTWRGRVGSDIRNQG